MSQNCILETFNFKHLHVSCLLPTAFSCNSISFQNLQTPTIVSYFVNYVITVTLFFRLLPQEQCQNIFFSWKLTCLRKCMFWFISYVLYFRFISQSLALIINRLSPFRLTRIIETTLNLGCLQELASLPPVTVRSVHPRNQ